MPNSIDSTHPEVILFDLGDTLVKGNRQWVDGAKSVLQRFSTSNFRIGVVSNTGDLDRAGVADLLPADFDWKLFEDTLIFLSAEQGVEKPDPMIFELALDGANVSANACLFCTENLHHILVAQSLGLRTARLNSSQGKDLALLADFLLGGDSHP